MSPISWTSYSKQNCRDATEMASGVDLYIGHPALCLAGGVAVGWVRQAEPACHTGRVRRDHGVEGHKDVWSTRGQVLQPVEPVADAHRSIVSQIRPAYEVPGGPGGTVTWHQAPVRVHPHIILSIGDCLQDLLGFLWAA